MTPQEVAEQIETLQPDLTEFNNLLEAEYSENVYEYIMTETNIYKRLFKTELFLMYFITHQPRYTGQNLIHAIKYLCDNFNWVVNNVSNNNGQYYRKAREYEIRSEGLKDIYILKYIANNKQYLVNYLKRKIYPPVSNVELKEPKDHILSLAGFKAFIKNKPKGLSSVEAEGYANKVKRFIKTKNDYITIILDNCANPSLKLQNLLTSILNNQEEDLTEASKYMYLCRRRIAYLARSLKIPVSESVFDDRHSTYKPFITKLNRVPTSDRKQFTYLVSALILLKTSNEINPNIVHQHFIESLTEHLEHEEYKTSWKEYTKELKLQTKAIDEVTKYFEK